MMFVNILLLLLGVVTAINYVNKRIDAGEFALMIMLFLVIKEGAKDVF